MLEHPNLPHDDYITITVAQWRAKLAGDPDWLQSVGACPDDRTPMLCHPGFSIDRSGNVWREGEKPKAMTRIGRGRNYVAIEGKWHNWRTLAREHLGIDL